MSKKIKSCKTIVNNIVQRIQSYTQEGKIAQDEDYLDGVLGYSQVYKYEEHYTLMERFNSERKLVRKKEIWYNENNQIIEDKSSFGKEIYEYGEDQRCLSVQKFDLENNIISTLIYNYIENDKYMKCFDSQGILMNLEITKYDEGRKPVRITCFERPERIWYKRIESESLEEFYEMMKVFKFDILGNKMDVELSMDYLIDDTFYEYDKFGNETLCEAYHYSEDFSLTNLSILSGEYRSYNDENLLVKEYRIEVKTDWDDECLVTYEYVLNESRAVVEKITNTGFKRFVEKFNYDAQGKLISYIESRKDSVSEDLTEILYDDFENKVSKIVKSSFKDEYDEEYEEITTKYDIEYYK